MPQFRKKPVVIEAVQWDGSIDGALDIVMWSRSPTLKYSTTNGFSVDTLEGVMLVTEGDWVIRGVKGEFYPCKPDIFAATYEPATP